MEGESYFAGSLTVGGRINVELTPMRVEAAEVLNSRNVMLIIEKYGIPDIFGGFVGEPL